MTDPAPRRHRAPAFSRFALVGAVVGVILATGVVMLTEQSVGADHATYSLSRTLMYFAVLGGGLGALLALVVALLLDRRG